jgi:hypothetical protein
VIENELEPARSGRDLSPMRKRYRGLSNVVDVVAVGVGVVVVVVVVVAVVESAVVHPSADDGRTQSKSVNPG